ncbi:efflux RND transporter periplasmic adaptor subunit [Pseudomonas sp. ZM23]|uniref:Efflux RND transporter periplasmic adaptor subunit n=1 Tax=Pseudomonas triclosanedens TaxID=2961893 RepID=A0ABY7A4F1_9PSED|nr:efflux RND transporter periplasmic adaptor subunit [Pseudomonas triclosanedens]MCP8464720.1 efflux RND transporter periplasmic adaptor subunit [Pseudomonas triclosanedens]MCP8470567.1 efflux RND transporter periplasmic adaptor subunit [Pseudomonas triclosanedens]MCP8476373.1 efflux RND transporter periplasmic adaptor subunit [Pseudomonas triclosanedens]WAI51401.1 efflux RND transporter periplasmic adaptor subunit [Pseudomonas triclosanedens]
MRGQRRVWVAAGVLGAAIVAAGLWGIGGRQDAPRAAAQPAGIPVTLARVAHEDLTQNIDGVGTVTSLHSVLVRPQVEGLLTALLVEEGQMVEKGQLLATIDDRAIAAALEQAEATRQSNQAQLRIVEQDLQRYRTLSQRGSISRQILEQTEAEAARLRGTLRGNQATIEAERVRLSYTRITSPVAGRVGIRNVDVGNLLRTNDSSGLFTVTQMSPISVVFALPQETLPRLQPLLGGAAPVVAHSRDGGELLGEGHLNSIDNQVASSTGTIRARAVFDNPDGKLWPGQFVTVDLRAGVLRNGLVLDSRAVRRGLDGAYVFRIEEGKAQKVPVRIVQEVEGRSLIEGLAAGDEVVLDGHSRLTPGARVEIQGDAQALARRSQP